MHPISTFRIVATKPDGSEVVLYRHTTLEIAVRLRRLTALDSAYRDVRIEGEVARPESSPA